MEGDCHGQRRTTQFWRKRGVTPSYIHGRLLAVCGEKAPANSTVFNLVWSFTVARKLYSRLSASGIATPLKKGAADPPGSCKGDGNNV